jgi:bile acid:Na+ symporter, BASS family
VTIDQIINILATITLLEMMVTIGLGVKFADVVGVGKNVNLVARAALANYLVVPLAALGLLLAFQAHPMVAAGFLIAAVCPGAPYGPPFTALAKGNVIVSVGLMVILAGSSAIIAPLLLQVLLPYVAGSEPLHVNVVKMVSTLALSQFLPLCVGVLICQRNPGLAERLKKPLGQLSTVLNLVLVATILVVQFRMLADITLPGYAGMLSLLISTVAAGAAFGGRHRAERISMLFATSVRNVGVSLVIATGSFPGTAAITSATAYALFQTILMALVAVGWGRLQASPGAR